MALPAWLEEADARSMYSMSEETGRTRAAFFGILGTDLDRQQKSTWSAMAEAPRVLSALPAPMNRAVSPLVLNLSISAGRSILSSLNSGNL